MFKEVSDVLSNLKVCIEGWEDMLGFFVLFLLYLWFMSICGMNF